ncbi:MAG: phenylalanine and histidine ammonia-lyase [Gammaproteobacteria bacterium]|nr:phenylalanine and histidine ammonia-lyase [Gammaproteobacteria bacterium]
MMTPCADIVDESKSSSIVTLTGHDLSIDELMGLAGGKHRIKLEKTSFARLQKSRAVVETMLQSQEPVYGLTTGLGAKVSQKLDISQLEAFSFQTLRGRAHAIGEALPVESVRAAMVVRLNTLLKGMSGASPAVATHLLACLEKRITPVVGRIGSIGASDLCLGATLGLSLVGEGFMLTEQGAVLPSNEVMKTVGLKPLALAPGDGLALASNSTFSGAVSAQALHRSILSLKNAQIASAMTMEAFRANPPPLAPFALTANPQSGQMQVAKELRKLLKGSRLWNAQIPRKLQDPLSIRNIVQVHGAMASAVNFSRDIIEIEINASSDNPIVDIEENQVFSCGAYHSAHLTVANETVSRAFVQVVMAQIARMSKLLSSRHSDLPLFLAMPKANSNGFAPYMKIAESLVAEIGHLATPVPIWPSVNADGSEDILSNAMTSAHGLNQIAELGLMLSAIEMIMASQALELQGGNQQIDSDIAVEIKTAYMSVRELVEPLSRV